MFVAIVGVVGVVGVVTAYGDYSDYGDHGNYSEYSDASLVDDILKENGKLENSTRELQRAKHERASFSDEAREELMTNPELRPFLKKSGSFETMSEDAMRKLEASLEKNIAQDEAALQGIDRLIQQVNELQLTQKPPET
jgi:hypothetical protein